MYRAFYENLTFAWLPQATTIFFALFFAGVLLRLFVFNGKEDFERIAASPLDSSEQEKRP
jgi:hypothetical protein